MRGQVGTTVKLEVKRLGAPDLINLEFKREKIKISNVPYYGMVGAHSGYIKLSDFTPDAGKEVRNAVVSLKDQGAKNIILDLRDNPGGLLFEAVNICNIFIPKGKKVVTTKGKVQNSNVTYETLNNPVDLEIPVAVLINRGSASASEIVAGTLQDYDRAIIIGEKSFGKGLVQIPRQLSYNSQVKITTAKYYTPTGRCIQVLDYSHRRADGSVGAIPDSVKKEFKTTNGRIVYDGGGVDPDIVLDGNEVSSLTQMLYLNGYIFDFATLYASQHETIPSAREFKLADKDYEAFVNYVRSKQYNYRSPVEVELTVLKEQAKRERYYEELHPQIEQIAEILQESRKNDLYTFKDQIKMLLEKDIASRYYLEKGITEVEFKNDTDIEKSVEVLNNTAEYKKILRLP
jgi:carboxyl-terminal processing protease